MFNLSLPELTVIGVVALLVLGPKRLPGAARTAGALLRRAQRSWAGLRADIERELAADEMKQQLKQAREELDAARLQREIEDAGRSIARDLDPGRDDQTAPATEATGSTKPHALPDASPDKPA